MEMGHPLETLTLDSQTTRISIATVHDLHNVLDRDDPVIVCDQNTALLAPVAGERRKQIVVPAGEECKRFAVLGSLLSAFQRYGLTRNDRVFAFGGGAVTDLVAFAASVYMRGIEVVLVPTSLLAMVDAAIGGKTGIDYEGYKNIVGSFYPASQVVLVPQVVNSLPVREYRSGLVEAIKAAFLGDETLLELFESEQREIESRTDRAVEEVIRRAVHVKVGVVARDFREHGERAFLNLGHTFGHALESVLGLGRWTHGEAVAWGIARAMVAGVKMGVTETTWANRVVAVLKSYGYDTGPAPVAPPEIVAAMYRDKKRTRGGLQFVLQRRNQESLLYPLEESQIIDILTCIDGGRE